MTFGPVGGLTSPLPLAGEVDALGAQLRARARRVGEIYHPLDKRVLRKHPHPSPPPQERERERSSIAIVDEPNLITLQINRDLPTSLLLLFPERQ